MGPSYVMVPVMCQEPNQVLPQCRNVNFQGGSSPGMMGSFQGACRRLLLLEPIDSAMAELSRYSGRVSL